jgi:20S proteasome alpha/beta subunit
MTLIAAFRASKGGVLLCSDRQEDDGISKKSIDKIYHVKNLKSCDVFMAGAGPSGPLKNTFTEIHNLLKREEDNGVEVAWVHHETIEAALKAIYGRYNDALQNYPMNLIVVVAPRAKNYRPMLYGTDGIVLSPESRYLAHGSGKPIADYLTGRLYADDLMTKWLLAVAAFILREASSSSSGVGLGSDMVLISNGGVGRRELTPESVSQIERTLPPLAECLHKNWMEVEQTQGFPTWFHAD